MESSESPPPNYQLVGKKLTERATTDIFAKFLGHEMRISSPIWLPEAWKNKIVDEMRGKFQRAFPGIDFSRVATNELTNIGFQTMFAETDREKDDTDKKPGIALLESLTQITATYTYLIDKDQPISLSNLEHCGMLYSGASNVDRITKSLMRTLWQYHAHHVDDLPPFDGSKLDQYTHETVQVIARALFSGNYQELKMKYSELPRGQSFDELLLLSIDHKKRHPSRVIGKTSINAAPESNRLDWDTAGIYAESKTHNRNQIIYNSATRSGLTAIRPIIELLGLLAKPGDKLRLSVNHE